MFPVVFDWFGGGGGCLFASCRSFEWAWFFCDCTAAFWEICGFWSQFLTPYSARGGSSNDAFAAFAETVSFISAASMQAESVG